MVLGVLRTGAAYVPVEPSTPPDRGRLICAMAAVPVLLVQPGQERYAEHSGGGLAGRAGAGDPDRRPGRRAARDPLPPVVREPAGLAYVIFTSGSDRSAQGCHGDRRRHGQPPGCQTARSGARTGRCGGTDRAAVLRHLCLAGACAAHRRRPGRGRLRRQPVGAGGTGRLGRPARRDRARAGAVALAVILDALDSSPRLRAACDRCGCWSRPARRCPARSPGAGTSTAPAYRS